jgi:dihydrofolate synthase/folylpolyglutamate synthase
MKLGLENITRLLHTLGNPQEKIPSIIVGGTNGKGSVTTYVGSVLRAAGYRTGEFYSPHLFRVNERMRLNGEEIPSPVLDGLLGELRSRYGRAPFTFFEGLTAAAVLYFVRSRADIAVFEVGLGGRLDATKLVHAVVTVITGIAVDHGEHLGGTRPMILDEKLGIIRGGVPLVANLDTAALVARARQICAKRAVPFSSVRDETHVTVRELGARGMLLDLETARRRYRNVRTRMLGVGQERNVATAVAALEVLAGLREGWGGGGMRGTRPASGQIISARTVKAGLRHAFLAGRFQVLPGSPRIILDVSHNEQALLSAIRTLLGISPPRRNVLIFGVLAHKRLGSFPRRAVKAAREIILTPLRDHRSASPKSLLEEFGGASDTRLLPVSGMGEAVTTARSRLGEGDTLLVLGSHLTVEEAAAYL